jgi:hypothetical protein
VILSHHLGVAYLLPFSCLVSGVHYTSEADLLRAYPTLNAADLTHAWAYVRAHRAEIEEQIRENEEA